MQVLISSGSGNGRAEDEVLLASTVRLLSRGARPAIVALSSDIALSSRAHPDLHFHPEAQLTAALESCSALLIVGDLRSPSRRERVALQVAQAKLARVPVALVAVHLPQPESMGGRDLCALLAQCESISASDAQSALTFSEYSGQRAHTTAPLELLADVRRRRDRGEPRRLGFDEDLLKGANPAIVRALAEAAAEAGASIVAIGHEASQRKSATHPYDRRATETWSDWLQEISDCDVFTGRVNSVAVHAAAGQGVVPIAIAGVGENGDLHERLGLSELLLAEMATRAQVRDAVHRALFYSRDALVAQAATLRTVAWRALGPLADATLSWPLQLDKLAQSSRRLVARALEARVRRALESGDYDFASRELERWRAQLENESPWALAQAQLEILQGHEADARVLLERAVATSPDDCECHATLAMVLWRLGDVDAARGAWERVAELEPRSARAPYQIGCLELLRGRMEQALRAWHEASGRDPSHAPSHRARSDTEEQRVRDGAA
jgi:tetratricopeptide (TPR) repeat protein